jgi:hypothetical protein
VWGQWPVEAVVWYHRITYFPLVIVFADIDQRFDKLVERHLASHSSVGLRPSYLCLKILGAAFLVHTDHGISVQQDFKGEFFLLIHCRGPDDLKATPVARAMLMQVFFAANHRSEESLRDIPWPHAQFHSTVLR